MQSIILLYTLAIINFPDINGSANSCKLEATVEELPKSDLYSYSALGKAENPVVIEVIGLGRCLSQRVKSFSNTAVQLLDGQIYRFTKNLGLEKINFGSSQFEEPDISLASVPKIRNATPITVVRVGSTHKKDKLIEQWLGAWPIRNGSVVAAFFNNAGKYSQPRVLFSTKNKVVSLRSIPGSPDSGTSVGLFLLEREPSNSLRAVTMSWRITNAYN